MVLRIRPNSGVTPDLCLTQGYPPRQNTAVVISQNQVRNFNFDAIIGETTGQKEMFDSTGMNQLVEAAVDGGFCSVICYGQTGAGKTHTLVGPPLPDSILENRSDRWLSAVDRQTFGIIPRAIEKLFSRFEQQSGRFRVTFSAVQIYNEQLVDMFDFQTPIDIRWTRSTGFFVEGLTKFHCTNARQAISLLYQGKKKKEQSLESFSPPFLAFIGFASCQVIASLVDWSSRLPTGDFCHGAICQKGRHVTVICFR